MDGSDHLTPVCPTRAAIPRRRPHTVRRRRLLGALRGNLGRRLTVLSAPAGYGKTTLLLDFVEDAGLNACWLTLDSSDRDPREFLADLSLAVGRFGPRSDHAVSLRQGPDGLRQALRAFISDVQSTVPEGLLVILDDYHTVDTSRVAVAFLEDLLSSAPDNWYIILSSRVLPSLPSLPRLLAQRDAMCLTSEDLAFDLEEVKLFLAKVRGSTVSEDEAKLLLERSEGWIAGLVLWTETGSAWLPANLESGRGADIVFDYLMAEVFRRRPPRLRRFLLSTSILPQMEPRFCNRLLSIDDSGKLLAGLERQNVFVSRLDAEQPAYRYHHLFRSFLRSKLLVEKQKEFLDLNVRAGELREVEGNWNEAIYHFSEAEKWPEVARIIRRAAEALVSSGGGVTLAQWIDVLPEGFVKTHPDVLLWRARVHFEQGEPDEALRVLLEVTDRPDVEATHRSRALIYRGACLSRKGQHSEAVRVGRKAVNALRQTDAPAELWAEAYLWLGISLGASGEFQKAVTPLKTALSLWEGLGETHYVSVVADNLGHATSTLGRLGEAESFFEKARQGWTRLGNDYRLAMTLNNLGVMYYWQGEYELTWDVLSQAMERARVSGNSRIQTFARLSLGDVKRDLGEYDQAIELYSQGLEEARTFGEPYLVDYAIDALGTTYMLVGDLGKAEILIRHAAAETEERGGAYERGLFATSLGILSHMTGDLGRAIEHLEYAVSLLSKTGAKRELARALFHLAHVHFAGKARRRALELLEEVASLVKQMGYSGFLTVEARRCPVLTAYAASKGIGGRPFVELRDAIEKRRSGPEGATTSRATLSLRYPAIEAYGLGQAAVKLDGRVIPECDWGSIKGKEMLYFLLCQPGPLGRDQIAASLWPEFDPARATSNFHSTLYRLRGATYFDSIVSDNGRYRLNPKGTFWFDVREFERAIRQADGQPRGSQARAQALEKALELYAGPFGTEFYSEWAETLRRKLEERFVRVLGSLAGYHLARGSVEKCLELCDRMLDLDDFNDEAHYLKVEAYLALGDRVSGMRHYQSYVQLLRDQLHTEPAERFLHLRGRLAS